MKQEKRLYKCKAWMAQKIRGQDVTLNEKKISSDPVFSGLSQPIRLLQLGTSYLNCTMFGIQTAFDFSDVLYMYYVLLSSNHMSNYPLQAILDSNPSRPRLESFEPPIANEVSRALIIIHLSDTYLATWGLVAKTSGLTRFSTAPDGRCKRSTKVNS